jgi:hypothetical protein
MAQAFELRRRHELHEREGAAEDILAGVLELFGVAAQGFAVAWRQVEGIDGLCLTIWVLF